MAKLIASPPKRRPFRPGRLLVVLGLLTGLLLAGCGGVSDDELERIKEENQALAAELESERRKSDILNQALASAYVERDRLTAALEAPIEPPEPQEAPPPPEPRIYVVKSGDTLGRIAVAHKTTTAILVSLNPFLAGRQDLMVWENDKITLPPE